MSEAQYTVEQAHLHFAKILNGRVWQLLESMQRTAEEDALMVHAAHACLYHWLQVGTVANHQRGLWLLSRVYGALGEKAIALQYARRCLALTEAYPGEMADFDVAYAYEGIARALALNDDKAQALAYRQKAEEAGKTIADAEDRQIFEGDLGAKPAS